MALQNNDVHVTAIRRTFGRTTGGDNVPAYEIHFTIRGAGDYTCVVPIAQFSAESAMSAIRAVAEPIVEVLDTFPGK